MKNNKEFLWGLALLAVIGFGIFFVSRYSWNKVETDRAAAIRQMELDKEAEVEKERVRQAAKTERSKERWGSLPFLRDENEGKD